MIVLRQRFISGALDISLEKCLGMEPLSAQKARRLMVIRAPENEEASTSIIRIMLQVVPPIRMQTLPIECSPVYNGWISGNYFTKGVYEWANGLLVVAHMGNILSGGN